MYGRVTRERRDIVDLIRPRRVERHDGNHGDFLDRHRREALLVARAGRPGLRKVAPHLSRRIADERTLRVALDDLEERGGHAPGPDGLRYEDLNTESLRWQFCRSLRDELRACQYHPGPERIVMVPKGPGRGERALAIQNIEDRVVQRAAVLILQPLLDPRFDAHSFGFRPGRSRLHALALAEKYSLRDEREVWVTEDITDAFRHVSLPRLLQLVRKYLLDDELTEFLGRILEGASTPGLRQGGSLSPLCLNLYLHHLLDVRWRKRHPDVPLLRVADDLLVLCRSVKEARCAHDSLVELLAPAGMSLKGDRVGAVRALRRGQAAAWLGFLIDGEDGVLRYRIADHAWERLSDALRLASDEPDPRERAGQIIEGWLTQMAPCWTEKSADDIVSQVRAVAREYGLLKTARKVRLRQLWAKAYDLWDSFRCNRPHGVRPKVP